MSEELKVRSFRADNETFEKFKQLSEDEFGNQGQCLSALINAYELEKSKAILVNRGLEIESFQDYLNKISGLFLTSLQLNQDTEGRIREEFIRQLDSKDKSIIELQDAANALITSKDAFEESAKALKDENESLLESVSDLKKVIENKDHDFLSVLADKDSLNKALTDSLNEKRAEIEMLKTTIENTKEKLEKFDEIEIKNNQLARSLKSSEIEIELQKDSFKKELQKQKDLAEIAKEKALTALQKQHQDDINKLNEQYNSKIQALLEKIEKLQERKDTQKTNIEGEKSHNQKNNQKK